MVKENIQHRYIFPNFLASAMKNLDMRTQMEAGMMSMIMLLIGMILMSVYSVLYLAQGWVFKALLVFNLAAGFIFMSGYLVTTYQQYLSYMTAISVQEIMGQRVAKPKPKKNLKNQILFFGGFILFGEGLFSILTEKFSLYVSIPSVIIGILMMASVFLRAKKNVYIDYTKNLNNEKNDINQGYQLEQEESGMADILSKRINSYEDEMDQQVLAELEEEEMAREEKRKTYNPVAVPNIMPSKVVFFNDMKGGNKKNGRRLPR